MENIKKELILLSNLDYTKAKPITTSDRIAKFSGYDKETVDRLIKNHLKDFKLVGEQKPPVFKSEGINGTSSYKTFYELDREQAMFLLTLMRNNERIIKFKADLINAFSLMEKELLRRQETRLIGTKIYRRNYTDLIQYITNGEDIDSFVKFAYSSFTDLIYKKVFGKTAKQLRIERKVKENQNLRDFLEVDELRQIQFWEEQVRKFCVKNKLIKLHSKEVFNQVKEFLQLDN